MRTILILVFLLSTVECFGGPGAIYSNGEIKIMKDNLFFKTSGVKIMSGDNDAPNSVAKNAPIGSLYIEGDTGFPYWKSDAGSSTNWTLLPYGDTDGNLILNPTTIATVSGNLAITGETKTDTIVMEDSSGGETITIIPPTTIATVYTLTLPDGPGENGRHLTTDGAGILSWTSPGAFDHEIAAFKGTGDPTVANNTPTWVDLEVEIHDDGGLVLGEGVAGLVTTQGTCSPGCNNGWRYVSNSSGKFEVHASMSWNGRTGWAQDERTELRIYQNDTLRCRDFVEVRTTAPSTDLDLQNYIAGCSLDITAGDTIQVGVIQTNGGTLSFKGSLSWVNIKKVED